MNQRTPSTLDPVGLGFYADIYRALGRVLSPREVDELELWQIGALLGVDRSEESSDPIDRLAAEIDSKRDSLARRAKPAEPLPEPVKGMVDVTAQMVRDMGLDLG